MERKSIDEKKRRPSGAAVMQTALTTSLKRAFFEDWAAVGYTGISLERVAAKAGAGKAAIYRRWPSKAALATELIAEFGTVLMDFSDNGSLESDLAAYLLMMRRALRHPLVRRILPDLYAERVRSHEISEALNDLADHRRKAGQGLLNRAIARGELPSDIDRELALDLIPAPLYWRMAIRGRGTSRSDIELQVRVIKAGLKVATQGLQRGPNPTHRSR